MAKKTKQQTHEEIEPWEQQPNETGPAFQAFVEYRSMGLRRTIQGAANKIQPNNPKYVRQLYKWSSEYDWKKRASLYDRDQDRIRVIVENEEVRQMQKRHINAALLGQAAAQDTLKEFAPIQGQKAKKKLKASDAIKLMEVSVKMERTARGEPETYLITQREQEIEEAKKKRSSLRALYDDPKASKHIKALLKLKRKNDNTPKG